MSKGHSQSRSQRGRRALKKNKGKESIEDVVVIDVDVVIIDAPETSGRPSRGVRERKRAFPIDAITIEDEEDSSDAPRNVRDDATNKAFYFASSSSYSAEELNNEECHMLSRKRNFASTSKGNARRKCNFFTPRNRFGLDLTSESNLSENASFGSDNSDCEIAEDSSGDIRKQWERAALRKRAAARGQLSSEDRASATGSSADPVSGSPERTHPKEDVPVETGSTNSRNACGNLSSTVPIVNKHTERSSPAANVNNIVEDSVMTPGVCHEVGTQQKEESIGKKFSCQMPNVDNSVAESIPSPGDCHGVDPHNEEELISEECSYKMQSICEPYFEFRRCNFRDVEVPLRGPSPCCSGLHAPPDMDSFQEQKEEILEETLSHMEKHCDSNISHEFTDVLEKERPFEPSLCNSQFLDGPQLNAVSHCVCSNEEATSREQLVNDHAMNGATENNLFSQPKKDLRLLQCDMISDREKHKASDLYMRADEIEWASRQQQLQIQRIHLGGRPGGLTGINASTIKAKSMSKGHSQSRSQRGRRALKKNKGKESIEDVVVIDVDVVIIDAPETSGRPSRGVRERKRAFPIDAITIEDEEDSSDAPRNVRDDATNKAFYFASSSSYSAEELNNEECHMLSRKRNFASTSKGNARRKCNFFTPRNRFGLDLTSESNLSENASFGSDNSDCEIAEDSSGDIRKQWERAALRKRAAARGQLSSEDRASATGSSADPVSGSPERTHPKEDVPVETGSTNSRNACGNLSSTVPIVNKHTERSSPAANVNNIVEDSVMTPGVCHEVGTQQKEESIGKKFSCQMPNVDNSVAESIPSPGDCHGVDPHNEEELISEECSYKMQSICEPYFEFRRCNFRDVEVPLRGPSPCCSGLHAPPDMDSFQEQKEEILEETLSHMEKHCDSNISHEFTDVLEKERPFEPSLCNSQFLDGPQLNAVSHCVCSNEEATSREQLVNDHAMNGATENNLFSQPKKDLRLLQCDMISDREKHKASDLYMRADEIEWASRQQQLQIQSVEAHRLRKKKRAERLLLDMKSRQKQRVEEVRESQRKDKETINLKDEIRAEVRKELDVVELRYRDMASLLQALGVHVEGGPFPRACEVNAAYKRALLKFHPDRSARLNDIRQQVMAEEKFKLISLKKKLLPAF